MKRHGKEVNRDVLSLSEMGNGYKFKTVQLRALEKIRPVEETITDK